MAMRLDITVSNRINPYWYNIESISAGRYPRNVGLIDQGQPKSEDQEAKIWRREKKPKKRQELTHTSVIQLFETKIIESRVSIQKRTAVKNGRLPRR